MTKKEKQKEEYDGSVLQYWRLIILKFSALPRHSLARAGIFQLSARLMNSPVNLGNGTFISAAL
jgi:hypothetical protein